MRYLLPILVLFLAGCGTHPGKAIIGATTSLFGGKTPEVSVQNPKNAEKPAEVKQGEAKTDITIQPGTVAELPVVVNGTPAVLRMQLPEIAVTKIERTTEAATGPERAPDKSVELRKADNAERRPLLYAAIGSVAIAVGFVYLRYPTPALFCGGAGALFFGAWHFAGERWLMNVAIGALVLGGAVYAIWEHRDRLEKKNESATHV